MYVIVIWKYGYNRKDKLFKIFIIDRLKVVLKKLTNLGLTFNAL